MNEIQNWDDYRLFCAVAQARGLVGATLITQVSAATLSRRMHQLEKRLGVSLFIRHREGYELTATGEILFEKAQHVRDATQDIEHWKNALSSQRSVKVAAGDWTSMFIAKHLKNLLTKVTPARIEMLSGTAKLDLGRREACLGIRNSRPKTQGLVGQRIARVEFAIYVAEHSFMGELKLEELNALNYDWLTLSSTSNPVASSRWLTQQLASAASISLSSNLALLEAVKLGVGCAVLPCFIGDEQKRLRRVSSTISELSHDQWLVGHADDRDNKTIGSVKDSLAALIRDRAALFSGNICKD